MISAGFTGGIRIVGLIGRVDGKFPRGIKRQLTEDFVGRNVMETADLVLQRGV